MSHKIENKRIQVQVVNDDFTTIQVNDNNVAIIVNPNDKDWIYGEYMRIRRKRVRAVTNVSQQGGSGGGGSEPLDAPASLTAINITSTSLEWSWGGVVNATNYVLERDTDSGFGSPTEVYSGASTSFEDTGLTEDQIYYYRVRAQAIDFSDSEYTSNNEVPTFVPYPETGQEYLEDNAVFYDLTNLTGADSASISNGNAGLNDLGPGGLNAVIVGTPTVRDMAINGNTVKTLRVGGANAISTGSPLSSIFSGSHKIFVAYSITDGIPDTNEEIFGGRVSGTVGVRLVHRLNGALQYEYGNSDGNIAWRSDVIFRNNQVAGIVILEIEVDFENHHVHFFFNGSRSTTSPTQLVGDISAINPANYNNTRNIYIGSLNDNGAAVNNTTLGSVLAIAFVPGIPTETQSRHIRSWFYAKLNWQSEITIEDSDDVNTLRTSLIASIFNGSGLPAITPTINTGHSGNMHICSTANIVGELSIDEYIFEKNDIDGYTWTNKVFLITTSTPVLYSGKRRLVFNIQGHISDGVAGHEALMNRLLSEGYDVAYCTLPIASDDNTETNPNITAQSTTGHDQIYSTGLDRVGYNPLELYFFDKTSFITELDGVYDAVFVTGISGGGWSSCLLAAFDTRITKAVPVRGVQPRTFRDNGFHVEGDYEQGGSLFTQHRCGPRIFDLFSTHTYMNLMIMGCTGGRKLKNLSNQFDYVVAGGDYHLSYRVPVRQIANSLGGDFSLRIDSDIANAAHEYSSRDIDDIVEAFED